MRDAHWSWVGFALLLCSCLSPFHCDGNNSAHDFAVNNGPYDLSVGPADLRTVGSGCTSLDQCNRVHSDRCDVTCKCGSDGPCSSGACCGGKCVDWLTDPLNCGGCGIACSTGICARGDMGNPHCTCDSADGGACTSSFEPTCNAEGLCSCGPSSAGVCNSLNADSCGPGGCSCGGGAACSGGLVDHCNPGNGCQCGSAPACDWHLATRCDPTQASPCRCANGPGCSPGTFCCTQNSTCCQSNQYCCLDGCCAHPCLLAGFCG
jgi:hypothetical protein